jgi:hypothetical protein
MIRRNPRISGRGCRFDDFAHGLRIPASLRDTGLPEAGID